jgi:predicted dehydrogenase
LKTGAWRASRWGIPGRPPSCRRKTAHLRDRLKTVTLFDGESTTEAVDPEEYGFIEENNDFIRSLRNGTPPPITHLDGLRATRLVLTAFESLKTGLPQTLSL